MALYLSSQARLGSLCSIDEIANSLKSTIVRTLCGSVLKAIKSALRYNIFMDVFPLEWVEKVRVQPKGFAPVTAELLQSIVQRIVAGVHPQKIVLFGSYAYGTPSPDSDLDILVVMTTTERPAQRVLVVSRLLRPRPFPMDILVRTPGEITTAVEHRDSFIQEILTRGKVLYEQHE
jgi:uncharacterized protein